MTKPSAAGKSWRVTVHARWEDAEPLWRPLFADRQGSPFQSELWLKRWYASFSGSGEVEPVLVHVADSAGRPAIALPLVLRKGGLRQIEFADLGITDYNAPLLGPAAPNDPHDARALWAAILTVLPPADLLVLDKMLARIGDRANPLALALPVRPSKFFGSYLQVDTDWETWLRDQEKHLRKELGRFWRVFARHEEARFDLIVDGEAAAWRYGQLEAQQGERIRELGLPYLLDRPIYADFYRELLADGLADGRVVLSALTAGDQLVAGLMGIIQGDHVAMVRISIATGEWANCSPGRLVIERTIDALSRRGFRTFDFAIGDYPYKRSFRPETVPLVEASIGLSWRGRSVALWNAAKAGAKDRVKQNPALERLARKISGRAA